ncbi:hypothetical protein GQ44DRAFT_823116 [Phaeosphaeriaceae sp. PMI808]|nr:hypothetical protein GQ44DRAFT_823116 [Phaeosphaeriaceae sp. PMI808]
MPRKRQSLHNKSLSSISVPEDLTFDADETSSIFSNLTLETNHRIIVGVDFGTTYTGISYIDSSKASNVTINDVHDIRPFPGAGGSAEMKMPSRIAYSTENEGITANQIGFQVTPKMISYSWTKLLLDQNAQATKFDDPSLKRLTGEGMLRLPLGKTATEVVADYFKEVYKWFMENLAKRISPGILKVTPMHFWFTVPAIWSDQAKSRMLSAVRNAGFASRERDDIFLVPEPEAAGVATLIHFAEDSVISRPKVGDGVLICDCGGGTVDITSYSIMQVSPKLQLEELVAGTGGKCGSTYRGVQKIKSNSFFNLF